MNEDPKWCGCCGDGVSDNQWHKKKQCCRDCAKLPAPIRLGKTMANRIKATGRDHDVEAEAKADQKCKHCNGKGYVMRVVNSDVGRQPLLCGCVRLVRSVKRET